MSERYAELGGRFAVVASRFNQPVVDELIAGAREGFEDNGVAGADVEIWRVPGAFELPLIVDRLARSRSYLAVLALGAVIRGETPHFEYISQTCADGLQRVALAHDVPVIFGVLTTEDGAQAHARAARDQGNKGREAALAALEMALVSRQLDHG